MYRKKAVLFSIIIIILLLLVISVFINKEGAVEDIPVVVPTVKVVSSLTPTLLPIDTLVLKAPEASKVLNNNYHIFQTFNNCGPASLSMALSYYGVNESQQK